jgi:hypothetical protein
LRKELSVIERCRLFLTLLLFCIAIGVLTPRFGAAQSQTVEHGKDAVPDKPSQVLRADFAGSWQVVWQGRLSIERCVLHFEQDGTKLAGTFQDLRGIMPLTGTVDGKKISFEVRFNGPNPFTTRFIGTANGEKIEGTSQAVGVAAYLGHAGEIVHPEHPWTATRVPNLPSQSTQTGSNSTTSTKN